VGPETVAALQHAVGSHGVVMGMFDDEEPIYAGQTMAHALMRKGALPGATAIEHPSMVGGPWFDEDEGAAFQGHVAVGQGEWSAPDLCQIRHDPRQMEQIGLQQLWAKKAEAAFGPGTAYHYSSPLTAQDLQAACALATGELGAYGGSLGGVNLLAGEYDDEEDEIFEVGQGCWSAPDINEALADPEQVLEMEMHAMPYGFPLPYVQQPMFGPPGGYPFGYPNFPINTPVQAPGTFPAGYPYGPMNAPNLAAPIPPTAGGIPVGGGVSVVPGQGYEIQGQPGRRF
jgi:hypothetical protein